MFLWAPHLSEKQIPYSRAVNLLPVNTLTYRGSWIEDLIPGGLSDDDDRGNYLTQSLKVHPGLLWTERSGAGQVNLQTPAHTVPIHFFLPVTRTPNPSTAASPCTSR